MNTKTFRASIAAYTDSDSVEMEQGMIKAQHEVESREAVTAPQPL